MLDKNIKRELRSAMLLTDPRARRAAARTADIDDLRGLMRPDPLPREAYTIHPISPYQLRLDTPASWSPEQVERYASRFVASRTWDGLWRLVREAKRGGLAAPEGVTYWMYERRVVLEEAPMVSLDAMDLSADQLAEAIAILTARMSELRNNDEVV